ncbi:hypothetical protein KI387_022283, partial [Taxus chinensis]
VSNISSVSRWQMGEILSLNFCTIISPGENLMLTLKKKNALIYVSSGPWSSGHATAVFYLFYLFSQVATIELYQNSKTTYTGNGIDIVITLQGILPPKLDIPLLHREALQGLD